MSALIKISLTTSSKINRVIFAKFNQTTPTPEEEGQEGGREGGREPPLIPDLPTHAIMTAAMTIITIQDKGRGRNSPRLEIMKTRGYRFGWTMLCFACPLHKEIPPPSPLPITHVICRMSCEKLNNTLKGM